MPSETFGPDELSELAEALESVCAEAVSRGVQIDQCSGHSFGKDCNCPFGALLNMTYPLPSTVSLHLGIPYSVVSDFMVGFDATEPCGLRTSGFHLGRLFREKYVTGGNDAP